MYNKALAVHGGAGTILKSEMTPELEAEYREGLKNALQKGWRILQKKGSSLDAVEAAVAELEDFPLFNAGRGAVFTHDGRNELDAAIMDGKSLGAGAVAFVRNVRNPVSLARLVMERTDHILLAGEGAIQFAREMGVPFEDDHYFFTQFRYDQLERARAAGTIELDHSPTDGQTDPVTEKTIRNPKSEFRNRVGTVGAVACDHAGNVAAATSTGGMTNKKFGRVGDTPLIGAGTYAENATCAVSCTGHGEYFMRGVTAYDVAARIKYKDINLDEAAAETIAELTRLGGEGGFIAVDAFGRVVLPFNSEGMYRGWIADGQRVKVDIYK